MDTETKAKIDTTLHLLRIISDLQKKYNEIIKITGEGFNIFNILKLSTNEVRTHSSFIGELLNPDGSHGLSSCFLKLFLEVINEKFNGKDRMQKVNTIDINHSNVIVEYDLGFIRNDGREGGRIDILIKDKSNNALIIENKIFAGDQKYQLIRYHNAFPQAPILYLTLDGKVPGGVSCEQLKENEDFFCIDYREDIINWLQKCKKEAVNYPLIRESITQYINLIKELTNQSISIKMKEEMLNRIVDNGDFIDAAFELSGTAIEIKKAIIRKFVTILKAQLGDEYSILDTNNQFGQTNYSRLIISNVKFWKSHSIGLNLSNDNETLTIGIYRNMSEKSNALYEDDLKYSTRQILESPFGSIKKDSEFWEIDYTIWNYTSWPDVAIGNIPLSKDIEEIFDLMKGHL